MNIVKKKLSKNFIKINPYKPSENPIHNSLGVDFDTAAILVLIHWLAVALNLRQTFCKIGGLI